MSGIQKEKDALISLKEARTQYLASVDESAKLSFAARRELADNYFNAQEERINNLPKTDEEKNKLIATNAKNHKAAIDTINKAETKAKNDEYTNQLTDAQSYYADLKRDEGTSAEDLKAARKAVYDYQKLVIETTKADETQKRADLAQIATDLKDDLAQIEDDKVAYNEKKRGEEIKAEQDAKDAKNTLAEDQREFAGNEMEKRASKAKLELGNILTDETTSLTDRQDANNKYYGWLKLEAIAREEDETKLATKLNQIEGDRIKEDRRITKEYAGEQETARKNWIKKQDDARKEAERIAGELKDAKVGKLEELEEKQRGVLIDLDSNENASADNRIEAVKRLFGIKLAKLQADKGDTVTYNAEKEKLENDLRLAIAGILDEDEKKRKAIRDLDLSERQRIAKEKLDLEQQTYNDVTASAQSSAADINEAAEDLYDAKVKWINLNVTNEEEAARQILQAQEWLDDARTTSAKKFFEDNAQFIKEGVELFTQSVKQKLEIERAFGDAQKEMAFDRAKSIAELEGGLGGLDARFNERESTIRGQFTPLILEALEAGDDVEANRLKREVDEIIGKTQGGQIIYGNQGQLTGLMAEKEAEQKRLTDEFHERDKDYFAELRRLQNEHKKDNASFWTNLGRGIQDFRVAVGKSIATTIGIPADVADMLAAINPENIIADFAFDKIEHIQTSGIQDEFLRNELDIFKQQSREAASNQRGGITSSNLDPALKGTSADPEVIEQKRLDALQRIQDRLKELYDDDVRDLRRTADAKKRIFDRGKDDEEKTIDEVYELYEAYYDKRKALIELTETDEDELKDALIRLSWERTDQRDAIEDEFERRQNERNQRTESGQTKVADTTIAESTRSTETQISNSDTVRSTTDSNLDAEIIKLKDSYETQVQLNTDLKDQLSTLQQDLADLKEGFIDKDLADNKESLDTKLTETTTHLSSMKEEYTNYFTAIKNESNSGLMHIARGEGGLAVAIKARLDYTLGHYKEFYQDLKDETDSAYQYIQERMARPGTRSEKSGSFSSPRLAGLSRQKQLQQKDRETVIQIKWDDGTTKKVQAHQVQLESDRRVFQ